MNKPLAFAALVLALAAPAGAHMTPPVALASEREAVTSLLSGSSRYFVREVRLSPAEKDAVRKQTGWSADDDYYRFYVGRGSDGNVVASAVLLTDFTIHGPVRAAIAIAPDGRVKGVALVEVTEETYSWVKPLLDGGFLQRFAGADPANAAKAVGGIENSMVRFYAGVIAGLVARASALYDVAISKAR
ncbi:MAG TPA: hypothetical protein VFA79_05620 [Myxococcales bacterium]|nr:hypothetical protein [Myxococcales bacterium]